MAEQKEEIQIKDRRRFAQEEVESQGPSPRSQEAPKPEKADTQKTEGPPPEVNFAGFIMSLSAQALICLGEGLNPQGGKVDQDLPAARQMIDILGMLKEKTKGNLENDEAQLLDQILFELRMKYVARTKR